MATKTTQQQVLLKYLVEQGTKAQVIAANAAIKKSMEAVTSAAKEGGSVQASEQRRVAKELKKLRSELIETEGGFHDLGNAAPRELQDVIDQVDELNKSIREGTDDLRSFDDKFGDVSKDVGLLGDIESQGRTVGGALGAAGLGGAESAIGGASELFAFAEAAPKLKAGLRGLPSTLSSAATSLGPFGVAAVGVGLGVAASTLILKDNIKGLSDLNNQMKGLISVQSEFFDVLANGTEADAKAAVEAAEASKKARELERNAILGQLAAGEKAVEAQDDFTEGIFRVVDALSGTPLDELKNQLSELNQEIFDDNQTIDKFTQGIEENAFAAESATQAEERLAAERTKAGQAAVTAAERERQRVQTTQALLGQSTEQLDARKKAIEEEVIATRAALKTLQDSGQVGDEVNAATGSYITTLQKLEEEYGFLENAARPLAAQEEKRAAALEAESEAVEESVALSEEQAKEEMKRLEMVQEMFQKRAKLEADFADTLIAISTKTVEASQKLLSGLEDKLAKLNQSLGRKLEDSQIKADRKVLEDQIKAQRDQVKVQQDHLQSLEDIRRKANEDEFGLQQARDFKGVANARRAARISIQDEQRNFGREEKQRILDLAQAAGDRARAFADARSDTLRKFRQDTSDARINFLKRRQENFRAGNQAIIDARARHSQELMDAQQAGLQALGIKRQINAAEMAMLGQVASVANQILSGLSSQLSSFQSFTSSGGNTNTTNNNNAVAINVSGAGSPRAVANNTSSVLRALI